MNPLQRLAAAVVALALALAGAGWGLHHYGAAHYAAGRADAIAERKQADDKAVLARTRANAAVAVQQAATNTTITKEKDDEIADLRRRLAAAPRLRVGAAVCADRPAAPTEAQGPTGSDSADPPGRLVSAAADRNFRQLIQDVEQDLATGRACQRFLEANGLTP